MQYMYQVRNTIAIDEEYYYKSNNFKYHKYAKGNEKNYAVCVSGEEYYCYWLGILLQSNNLKCHKYAKWNEKIMQYMYQVRNIITIDEEYYYKSNNLKYHKSLSCCL